ncbi:MAG: 30S ribosomal protein S4 [Deltaproteobacteria bacterium]|nr:30S ribosomal protein S4 [Deltaproteobacteria bacterium]
MACYTGASCRLCRREGEKLFLKGERCYSNKCAMERRDSPPGVHVRARGRFSEFRLQLREKQKVKRMYGLLERQFRTTFARADRLKGVTGENLLGLLERRLDNIVYRAGFASSRREGRQFIAHGHVLLNGKSVNIPSCCANVGDVIEVAEKSRSIGRVNESLTQVTSRRVPDWLELNKENYRVTVRTLPAREQLTHPMNEQLIVELYSK